MSHQLIARSSGLARSRTDARTKTKSNQAVGRPAPASDETTSPVQLQAVCVVVVVLDLFFVFESTVRTGLTG